MYALPNVDPPCDLRKTTLILLYSFLTLKISRSGDLEQVNTGKYRVRGSIRPSHYGYGGSRSMVEPHMSLIICLNTAASVRPPKVKHPHIYIGAPKFLLETIIR